MDSLEKIKIKQREFVKERNWDQFQSPKNLSIALAVEASELMEVFMWLNDQEIENLPSKFPALAQNAKEEMADVLVYLVRIADVMNIDLLSAVEEKMKKNRQKYPIEKGLE
jgi:NTP pyrophosphatase (non-canonical NTP hydrolase)